jgi:hypothetical protein
MWMKLEADRASRLGAAAWASALARQTWRNSAPGKVGGARYRMEQQRRDVKLSYVRNDKRKQDFLPGFETAPLGDVLDIAGPVQHAHEHRMCRGGRAVDDIASPDACCTARREIQNATTLRFGSISARPMASGLAGAMPSFSMSGLWPVFGR